MAIVSSIAGPVATAITSPGVGGVSPTAFSAAKAGIVADAGDVNILVVGDSTGNAADEWVYLFGQWIATQYPTHSVSYRLWNDVGAVYDAAASLGTGSGANTIRIWNASVSGSKPIHLMGSSFQAAVVAPAPTTIIWNHGHNLSGDGATSPFLPRGGFLSAMEQVRRALPGVPHMAIRQNPRRDDSQMAVVVAALDDIAADYGDTALIDVYARFIAAGKPAGWYADNVHPNATGTAEYLAAVQSAWQSAPASDYDAVGAFLDTLGTNLLPNANFGASYAGGTPVGWATAGTPTGTVETTIKEGAQSLKITGTAAGSGYYAQITPPAALLGGKATLAVRQYVPPGETVTAGRIALFYNNGSNVSITTTGEGQVAVGGWRWYIISGVDIPANTIYVRAYLYANTAATGGATAYYDRAILVAGDLPRNVA